MDNFNLSRTLVENINEQNDKINNCIDIVNGLANDEEIKVIQELRINEELRQQNELVRQQNELIRQEQYNNNENRFTEINTQLDNKTNLSNKRISVMNETTDNEGVIDLANFAGQGTSLKDIMAKLHNYTDSDVMWLDNVGEGNTILRLNNSRNPVRREDKGSDFVGSGDYLVLGRHKNDGSIYYQVLKIDKDGNFLFNNSKDLTGAIKFDNNKLASDGEPGFIFRTPSGRHDKIASFQTSSDNREVLSIGVHASGTLAEIDLGGKMINGLVFNLPSGSSLQSGIGGNVRTIPNVRIQNYAPTSIAPEFIGQIFVNTAQASQGLHPSVYIAWGTDAGNWVALD